MEKGGKCSGMVLPALLECVGSAYQLEISVSGLKHPENSSDDVTGEAPPTALCCCIMGNVSSDGEVWSGVTLFADDDDDDGKLGKRKNI